MTIPPVIHAQHNGLCSMTAFAWIVKQLDALIHVLLILDALFALLDISLEYSQKSIYKYAFNALQHVQAA